MLPCGLSVSRQRLDSLPGASHLQYVRLSATLYSVSVGSPRSVGSAAAALPGLSRPRPTGSPLKSRAGARPRRGCRNGHPTHRTPTHPPRPRRAPCVAAAAARPRRAWPKALGLRIRPPRPPPPPTAAVVPVQATHPRAWLRCAQRSLAQRRGAEAPPCPARQLLLARGRRVRRRRVVRPNCFFFPVLFVSWLSRAGRATLPRTAERRHAPGRLYGPGQAPVAVALRGAEFDGALGRGACGVAGGGRRRAIRTRSRWVTGRGVRGASAGAAAARAARYCVRLPASTTLVRAGRGCRQPSLSSVPLPPPPTFPSAVAAYRSLRCASVVPPHPPLSRGCAGPIRSNCACACRLHPPSRVTPAEEVVCSAGAICGRPTLSPASFERVSTSGEGGRRLVARCARRPPGAARGSRTDWSAWRRTLAGGRRWPAGGGRPAGGASHTSLFAVRAPPARNPRGALVRARRRCAA